MDSKNGKNGFELNNNKFDQNVNKIEYTNDGFYLPLRYVVAILALLAGSMVYLTRVNLSVAIVAMSRFNKTKTHINGTSGVCESPEESSNSSSTETNDGEFEWNQTEQGVILGAFFYGYIFFQIVGGRLAEIFGAKWLAAGGITMSIIINSFTPLIAKSGYVPFIASRVCLGVSQAFVFPSLYALITKWLPDHERGYLFYFN
jgi:MFS family permease